MDEMLIEEQQLQADFLRSQKVTPIPITPTRIVIPEGDQIPQSGNVFECTNEHADAKLLFSCLAVALHDVRTYPKKYVQSKLRAISLVILEFVPWLNRHTIGYDNRATIVKDFETYRVNECKVKPQSSHAGALLNAIRVGLALKEFKNELSQLEVAYLGNIIDKTKLSKESDPEQNTLTNYFSRVQWIREYMDNDLFNRVASPKALMTSFSITVATLMLEAQRLLDQLELYCIKQKITTDMLSIVRTIKKEDDHKRAQLLRLLNIFCKDYSNETPECIKVMLFDISNPDAYADNQEKLKVGKAITKKAFSGDSINTVSHDLGLFNYNTVLAVVKRAELKQEGAKHPPSMPVTVLEEMCFIWLMAWQAVQPSDIAKLKKSDFRLMERSNGSVTHISCEYYKGRAGDYKEAPLLAVKYIEGEAVLSFIQRTMLRSDDDTALVSTPSLCKLQACGATTFIAQIFGLATFPLINTKILSQLGKRKTTSVFPDTVNTMISHGRSKKAWKEGLSKGLSYKDFCAQVNETLPVDWFGLQAIKNSAVHSRSDRYRIGHLVNYNSHENATERDSYLTPDNQEWLNNCGRVTRSVMNDMAINVLNPSRDLAFNGDFTQALEVINDKKNDVLSRLKLVTNTTGNVNELGIIKDHIPVDDDYPDTLYLLDTPETYVQMKHYLAEGLKHYKQLIRSNSVFLEYTVLPTCEWIEVLFNASNLKQANGQGFSQETVKQGNIMYKTYQAHLPPLFTAQLKG
ncbi:hypothetical protein PSH55_01795 [Pseudoalteromonas sp. Angola-31]|nr:hypothetical protein [Pseudoalteromonas sp. Angola-31]